MKFNYALLNFALTLLAPFFALLKRAFGSQKNVGTRNMVSTADTIKPPTEAIPIGCVMAATLPPRANASGSWATTEANVASTIGWNLDFAAVNTAELGP